MVQQTIQDMLTHSLLITDAFALPEALLGNAQNDEADLGGTFLIDDFQDLFTPE